MRKSPNPPSPGPRTNRRRLLIGLGAMGSGALAAGLAHGAEGAPADAGSVVTDAPTTLGAQDRHDYLGVHQAGITTPRPRAGMVVAFDVLARRPADLARLFRTLTDRIAFLTQGGPVPKLDPLLPPADSGILGPYVEPDKLTITVSVGESFFDHRFGLGSAKPARLSRMGQFPNDALDPARCHGDLSLQFCANTSDTNIHALRDIIKHMPDLLLVRWKQEGSVPPVPQTPGPRPTARNFLGFRDGTANPDTRDEALMERIVWTHGGGDEPRWVEGGSYQAVRLIRNFVERWDRTPLHEQEQIFGRHKASGAPLGGRNEHDPIDYSEDPGGMVIPLTAHIRLANPRTPESSANLLLRRPFNYSNGVEPNGQLDQGLIFIAYQADLEAGFITVQNRLNGEPLEEYVKPFGGGYFFTLPGITDARDFFGRTMLEAAGLPTT